MEAKVIKPLNATELARLKKLVSEYRPSMDKAVVHGWGHDVTTLLRGYLARIGEL